MPKTDHRWQHFSHFDVCLILYTISNNGICINIRFILFKIEQKYEGLICYILLIFDTTANTGITMKLKPF